jgi:hypothetical protein
VEKKECYNGERSMNPNFHYSSGIPDYSLV